MLSSHWFRRILLLTVLLGITSSNASAVLRSPQVPVLTNHLQGLLNGLGESINVATDQRAGTPIPPLSCDAPVSVLQFELVRGAGQADSVGIYNLGAPSLERMTLFPAEAKSGWFAVAVFHSSPPRVVVNAFDETATLLRTTVFPGGDRSHEGVWVQGAGGTFFSEDARNPRGAAQVLWFAGTGINSGSVWICIEAQPVGAGSDQDYADDVLYVEYPWDCGDPVQRSTWGAVKRRFH